LKEHAGKVEANGLHYHALSSVAPSLHSDQFYFVVGSVAECEMFTPNSIKLMYNKERMTNLKNALFVTLVHEAHNRVLPSFLQQVQEL